MAFPQNPYLKYRYYNTATTSTSGAPTSTVVVASRCKYIGGYYVPNQIAGTGTNVTGFDVVTITAATSVAPIPTAQTVSSGVGVTTSTGTYATAFAGLASSATTASLSDVNIFLNPGDLVLTLASTGVGGFVTHVVQEF